MKFMLISYATKDWEAGLPPDPRLLAAMPRLSETMPKDGALIGTGGLAPSSMGAKVRVSGGKVIVTDGPFAETKEIVGGYAIVDVSSKDEAIAIAKQFWQLHVDTSWVPCTRVEAKFAKCFTRRNVAHNTNRPACNNKLFPVLNTDDSECIVWRDNHFRKKAADHGRSSFAWQRLVAQLLCMTHNTCESPEMNSNCGFNLTWWDFLLGTYRDQPAAGREDMMIGLKQFRDNRVERLDWMLILPFVGVVGENPLDRREARNV